MHPVTAVQRGTHDLIAPALLALLAAACGGATVAELGPTLPRCTTSVSSAGSPVSSAGGNINLQVSAARECTWAAASEASWLSVRPASGQGAGTVAVTVAPNAQAAARTGAVTVNDSRVTVTQQAGSCLVELNRSSVEIGHEGGRTSVSVSTTQVCSWSASSSSGWLQVLTPSGSGSATVELEASPNSGPARNGAIVIAGRTFTVSQRAHPSAHDLPPQEPEPAPAPPPPPAPAPPPPAPPPPAPTPPAPCTFRLDPDSRSFNRNGGNGAFRVVTANGCAWTVSSGADWVSILSGATGTGPGDVRYRVEPNDTPGPRSTQISAGGQTHAVSQAAGRVQKIELEGRVSNLAGSCPDLSFSVSGRTVVTDSATKFDDGSCRDIRNGIEVEIEGELLGDGRVRAIEVEIDD